MIQNNSWIKLTVLILFLILFFFLMFFFPSQNTVRPEPAKSLREKVKFAADTYKQYSDALAFVSDPPTLDSTDPLRRLAALRAQIQIDNGPRAVVLEKAAKFVYWVDPIINHESRVYGIAWFAEEPIFFSGVVPDPI
jgi:hypothetical protein